MTVTEFRDMLVDPGDDWIRYNRLTALGDELVRRRIRNEEDFWSTVQPEERTLFALCSIMHLVGQTGFDLLFQQFSGSYLAIVACAQEGFEKIDEPRYAIALRQVMVLVAQYLDTIGVEVPPVFDASLRNVYLECEIALEQRTQFFHQARGSLQRIDEVFARCDKIIPRSVLAWIRQNQEVFEQALCQ